MKKTLIFACSLASLCSIGSGQITIVNHTFDGGTDGLNGAAVDTVAAGVSTTWTASSSFRQNGTITDPGSSTHRSAFLSLGSLLNSAKGQADGIFTLTVEWAAGITNQGGWVASGLQNTAGDITTSAATGGGIAWTMWDGNPLGQVKAYDGPNTSGTVAGTVLGTESSGGVTFTTVIDLSGHNGTDNFGSIAYSFNSGSVTNSAFTTDQSFASLQISTFTNGATILSVELTQVPEPSTYALLGGLMALGLVMVRRRQRL